MKLINNHERVACILAAGTGSRLKSHTKNNTKCMIEVAGERLIDRILKQIIKANFSKVIIVVGFGADKLIRHVKEKFQSIDLEFISNPDYATTNNIYSLKLAVPILSLFDEVVIFESDVWINDHQSLNFLTSTDLRNHALVSPYEYWMDGTCAKIARDGSITALVSKKEVSQYDASTLFKTANWYRLDGSYFRKYYSPFIDAYIKANGNNSYYEDVLKVIIPFSPVKIYAHSIPAESWMEIDDEEDLRRASILASASNSEIAQEYRDQYGGYWKNSYFEDLTLLENPYFPTGEFWKEFTELTAIAGKSYPSKQSIISGIFAKSSNVEPQQVAVGNGVSELMMTLFNNNESYSIVEPYFLEYQRILKSRLKVISRTFPDVSLWDSLIDWRNDPSTNLIVISPNNPTGEYLTTEQLLLLVEIGASANRKVVVDESFSDFSNIQKSLLFSEILERHNNLIVLKSLGKSYGIGGMRLGVLCSSDRVFIQEVRSNLPIWNVSSYGEVFLDLLPKYKAQYADSLNSLMSLRSNVEQDLEEMNIVYYPTQTNFVLIRVRIGFEDAVDKVFFEQGLLVKTLKRSSMRGPHLRIALKSSIITKKVLKIISDNRSLFVMKNSPVGDKETK
jgi:histidinol-phosphate/aromatic aminotransferase/cobyric acid decarboxylase-like protein/choline kinase